MVGQTNAFGGFSAPTNESYFNSLTRAELQAGQHVRGETTISVKPDGSAVIRSPLGEYVANELKQDAFGGIVYQVPMPDGRSIMAERYGDGEESFSLLFLEQEST